MSAEQRSSGGYWNLMAVYVVAMFLALGVFLLWVGIRVSNRISGPLYRVRVTLESVAKGETPERCRIREGDEHPDVADAMCAALTAIRRRQDADALAWREQADQLRQAAASAPEEVAKSLEALAHAADLRGKPAG
jgi:hypothetical protein